MPQQARVSSLEAIESFRSQLIVYLSQARPALEEVASDVLRCRIWLETDQRLYWENQLRLRQKKLEEAQAALFSARLGILRRESGIELMAVQRAKRAVEEAETKLRALKKWHREFDSLVQPPVKQMEKLQTIFAHDMVQAVAYLSQTISNLAAYAEMHAPSETGASSAAQPNAGSGLQTGSAAPNQGGKGTEP